MIKNLSISVGQLWGTEIRLHLTFLLLVMYIVLPEFDQPLLVAPRAFALSLIIFIAVVLHEMAHIVVARMCKFPSRIVILLPIGGVTLREAAEGSREMPASAEIKTALAGPMFSLITGGIMLLGVHLFRPEYNLLALPHININSLAITTPWVFIYLGALNLIPAYPLDGGRILRALFTLETGMTYETATRRAVTIGQVFAIGLIFASIFMKSNELLLVGFILFVGVQLEDRTLLFHAIVDTVHLEDIMLTEFATLSPADTLEDALQKSVHSLQDDFPVIRGGSLVGVISRSKIVETIREEGNGYVQSVMNKVFEVAQKRASLAWALRQFTGGTSIIPVVDDQMLVGIITRQNLMRSMGLLAETRKLKQDLSQTIDDEGDEF
jgi:Zn-dependent protease